MKKLSFVLSVVILSLILGMVPSKANAATISTTGTASSQQTAYLYPDNTARTMYYTYKGDNLYVLCTKGSYTLIAYPWLSSTITANKVVYAWVPTSTIVANGSVPAASTYFDINKQGVVNTPGAVLNVRVQPSTNALTTRGKDISILGTIPHNTAITVLFELNGWYYIETQLGGKPTMGFVSKDFVTISQAPATSSNVVTNPQQKKIDDTIALAKNLKKVLDSQGGPCVYTEAQIKSSSACYQAMLKCNLQSVYNSMIIDVTSAAVKATVEAAKVVKSGGASLIPAITNTVKGVGTDALKSTMLDQIDRLSIDDYVLSLATNANDNVKSQALAFVSLHYSSNLDSYKDAVNYIILYQSLRMNSRTVRFGMEYFAAKLPSDFKASLTTVIRSSISNFLPEKEGLAYDMANKVYELYAGSNIPLVQTYGQDMKALWNETVRLTSLEN